MNLPDFTAPPSSPLAIRRSLPGGYRAVRRLDLESPRTLLALALLSLLMLAIGLLFFALVAAFFASSSAERADPLGTLHPLLLSVALIIMFVLMLAAHEAFHGLAFRSFGARPRFGLDLKKGVAFAAAPDDYLSRNAYLVVALAPIVGVTVVCILLMALTGDTTRNVFAVVGAANVSGAAGDVWFFVECLRRGPDLIVRDYGEGAELYLPALPGSTGEGAGQIHEDQRGDASAGEDQD